MRCIELWCESGDKLQSPSGLGGGLPSGQSWPAGKVIWICATVSPGCRRWISFHIRSFCASPSCSWHRPDTFPAVAFLNNNNESNKQQQKYIALGVGRVKQTLDIASLFLAEKRFFDQQLLLQLLQHVRLALELPLQLADIFLKFNIL